MNLIESDEDDVKVEPPQQANSKLAEILDEIETENHPRIKIRKITLTNFRETYRGNQKIRTIANQINKI